ncbi:MAG: anti-sigma factor [Solirubrobacterales bacterium]|nr:anti-sigma factor [Solirubrobacterales bacterium]
MNPGDNDRSHARFEADVAAYALHALDDAEVGPFEAHLKGCASCRAELAEMRAVIDELPTAAPVTAAPSALRDRVMTTIRAEADQQAHAQSRTSRKRGRDRRPPLSLPRWLSPGVAAATAAVVAVLVVVAISTVGSNNHQVRTYAGIVYARGGSASLQESAAGTKLRVSKLPPPPADRIYQVWLERAQGGPQPTAALFPTSTGSVAVPGRLRGVHTVLVTAEPRPQGSRAPTRAPIVVVHLT